MRRPRPKPQAPEPLFGPPATTPEEAFVRFGNACHWALTVEGVERAASPEALRDAALARLPRAEHRLVAAFIAELTGGGYTFAEAGAIWQRSQNDMMWMTWNDASAYLRFLLLVRDAIDPTAWPASTPRFRQEGVRSPPARKRSR